MNHVKTRILSDSFLRENFAACVNLFQDFITQKEADPTSIIIAAVSQGQVLQDVVGGKPKGTGKLHGQKRGKPGGKAGNTVKGVLSRILVLKVNIQIVKRSCPQEVRKIVSQKSGTLRWRKIKKYLSTM